MTLNVMYIDSAIRVRDFKEISALQYAYPKKFKFVFVVNSNKAGNKIEGVKVVHITDKNPTDKLVNICKAQKIDIIHSHNHPDTYGYWAMLVRKRLKIPFVHECHDIAYHNTSQEILNLERMVMKGADAIITVSGGMTDHLHNKYGIRKKCTTIYSYPNKRYLPALSNKARSQFTNGVYQGAINNIHTPHGKYNHRYYKDVFTAMNRQGLTMNVYPQHGFRGYDLPKVKVHPRENNIKTLYKKTSNYDFGFVGYNNTGAPFLDFAMPNKLFEYISAGLPILCQNYFAIAKFVRTHQLGVVINKNTLKLPKNFHSKMTIGRKNARKKRFQFTMERQAPKLLDVYEGLI